MSDNVLSEIRKDYLYHLVMREERASGRVFEEFRDISVETGTIRKADGSAMVRLGDTQVLVGVKIQPGEPYADSPNKGVIITNAELVPLASPEFEPGPPNEYGVELARVVDRGVRESKSVDLEALCIAPGEQVWIVFIDIHILDDCGNIMDASSLGAIAALMTATIPAEQYGLGEDYPLPVRDVPVATTAVEFGGVFMFDPDVDEEAAADTKLTVISTAEGCVCGMQKSGSGVISKDHVHRIVDISCEKAKEIREKFLDV